MSQKFDDLKKTVEDYIAASVAAIETAKVDVQAAVDAAIAAHEAGEGDAFDGLKAEVADAFAKIGAVKAPVVDATPVAPVVDAVPAV